MNEASKIRSRVLPILERGTVLDLGCGDEKIVPWAIGVDDASEWRERPKAVDVCAKIDPTARQLEEALRRIGAPAEFDTVFSSHAIEHLVPPPAETLRYWIGFAKIGGFVILQNVDERHYLYDRAHPWVKNPAHRHLITKPMFDEILAREGRLGVLENELRVGPDEYSVLIIARRLA